MFLRRRRIHRQFLPSNHLRHHLAEAATLEAASSGAAAAAAVDARTAAALEVAALAATLGGGRVVAEDVKLSEALEAHAREGDESLLAAWAAAATAALLRLTVAPPPGARAGELRLALPPGYPLEPAACAVSSPGPRAADAATAAARAALAAAAAARGEHCLFDIATAWEEGLLADGGEEKEEEEEPRSPAGASPSGRRPPGGGGSACGCLLRLHHMHDRPGYSRAIGRAATASGLAGRLVFSGRLILILLYGPAEALEAYLTWHRTATPDVDSRGRRCRERMMEVVCRTPAAAAAAPLGGGGGEGFEGFREVEASPGEAIALLGRLGCGGPEVLARLGLG
jgi:hypothetical protein